MGGQGLNPLSLGGSENVGAEESESNVTEDADIERLDQPVHKEHRSWRHRNLPDGQDWNRLGTDSPIITAADLPADYDDFVADCHLTNVDGDVYIAFEAQSTTLSGTADTWIAKLDMTYNDDATISSASVDLLAGSNPAIDAPNHQAFPFIDRVGDTIYVTSSGGDVSGSPNLYKISYSDFKAHNFSGFSFVRELVSPTGNTGPDGDWNGSFKADSCWLTRNGYHFLLTAAGRQSGEHHALGVWYTRDRENGDLTLHPDAPVDFDPYSPEVGPFPLDLGRDILMWDHRINLRRITELTTESIAFDEPEAAMRAAGTNQEQGSNHSLSVVRDGNAWLGAYDATDSSGEYKIFLASQAVN